MQPEDTPDVLKAKYEKEIKLLETTNKDQLKYDWRHSVIDLGEFLITMLLIFEEGDPNEQILNHILWIKECILDFPKEIYVTSLKKSMKRNILIENHVNSILELIEFEKDSPKERKWKMNKLKLKDSLKAKRLEREHSKNFNFKINLRRLFISFVFGFFTEIQMLLKSNCSIMELATFLNAFDALICYCLEIEDFFYLNICMVVLGIILIIFAKKN